MAALPLLVFLADTLQISEPAVFLRQRYTIPSELFTSCGGKEQRETVREREAGLSSAN